MAEGSLDGVPRVPGMSLLSTEGTTRVALTFAHLGLCTAPVQVMSAMRAMRRSRCGTPSGSIAFFIAFLSAPFDRLLREQLCNYCSHVVLRFHCIGSTNPSMEAEPEYGRRPLPPCGLFESR